MYTKGDLTKGTLSYQFHKLVEVQGRRRQLVVLFNVLLNVFYEVVTLLDDCVVDLGGGLGIRIVVGGGLAAVAALCTCACGLRIAALGLVGCCGLVVLRRGFGRLEVLIAILNVNLIRHPINQVIIEVV